MFLLFFISIDKAIYIASYRHYTIEIVIEYCTLELVGFILRLTYFYTSALLLVADLHSMLFLLCTIYIKCKGFLFYFRRSLPNIYQRFDKYFQYSYFNETNEKVGVFSKDTPEDILREAKNIFDVIEYD